ncbi:assimilatory sulfite reductase (NADPH) flavoprotein subunit [Paenibacillus sp. 1P07SE]|uniref:assimilatory sulfite reductase (NADPH) flavoprotein subunit n=1 Tax=Paenibacillus sp. 1P07SE TaxID=3132209 RepID=UPI0039A7697C
MQFHVTNSPFNEEQAELLNRLLPTLTPSQVLWLSGYLAAAPQAAAAPATGDAGAAVAVAPAGLPAAVVPVPAAPKEVTVLFGSQTGNAQRLAQSLARTLEEQGLVTTLTSMRDFKPAGLKKLTHLLILVSTHGEGDPPDAALPFYEFLHSKRAPKLDQLKFSVLGLGDTSYEFYCQTGKDFDKRLEELGGERLAARADCDVDYDEAAAAWFREVQEALKDQSHSPAAGAAVQEAAAATGVAEAPGYSRTHPFEAEILDNINLNGRGSNQETRHLELSLEGSNLQYEPGDALGIYPQNHPELVELLIRENGWQAEELVPVNKDGDERSLTEALTRYYEITVLTKLLMVKLAELSSSEGLRRLVADEGELKDYLGGRDLLDVSQDFGPLGLPARQFVGALRKIPARLYSISSSLKANPDEVHLTIRTVRYESQGRSRYGVCSVQCAERAAAGDSLPVYIHENPNFKLPQDGDTPIIMIGPGTGVAPFRAFLQEREENGDGGKSWLFFGDQHFHTDFLYQTEWQQWLQNGTLTRMDVAFSRDTEHKVYVQHRMKEQAADLVQWLKDGAYLYVCGDEKRMANDVHLMLAEILEQEGGMTPDEASAYLTDLVQQRRYQRDIY